MLRDTQANGVEETKKRSRNTINVYTTIDKVSINKIITFFLAKECFELLLAILRFQHLSLSFEWFVSSSLVGIFLEGLDNTIWKLLLIHRNKIHKHTFSVMVLVVVIIAFNNIMSTFFFISAICFSSRPIGLKVIVYELYSRFFSRMFSLLPALQTSGILSH